MGHRNIVPRRPLLIGNLYEFQSDPLADTTVVQLCLDGKVRSLRGNADDERVHKLAHGFRIEREKKRRRSTNRFRL